MGVTGGRSPHGLSQRYARTVFLRAPATDWGALTSGRKSEFRVPYMGEVVERGIPAPTPVVLYVAKQGAKTKARLAALLEHRTGVLYDLSEDQGGLSREGFETYDHFRTYWRRRTHRPYDPLAKVHVFRLAPWNEEWEQRMGRALLERLYGEFL